MSIKKVHSVLEIEKDFWNSCLKTSNPFLKYEFFYALEKSKSIGHDSGWLPQFIIDEKNLNILFYFLKVHSYGEYIFDWDWANTYHNYQINYYPKLTSMIPFTPVPTSHFLNEPNEELFNEYIKDYQNSAISSAHFLFTDKKMNDFLDNHQFETRESFQYHFTNKNYKSFDDFLDHLKSKKAKQIKKERQFSDIKFQLITQKELNDSHATEMFEFYQSTILEKGAIQYLNQEFFNEIFKSLKENILYIRALQNEQVIAGSLFLYDDQNLYGRYWGATEYIKNLHFELCYYQGIDFLIHNKLSTFYAGAQGEHKIKRGFIPTRTFSAHKIKHPAFAPAISSFINQEKLAINKTINYLNDFLPYKNEK